MPIKHEGPDERPEQFKLAKRAYYGSAQEVYNVHQNQAWAVGPHRLLCGDLLELWKNGMLLQYLTEADVIYTDPPWTASIYSQFYTNADSHPTVSYDEFLDESMRIIRRMCPDGIIFIESGLGSVDTIISKLEALAAHTLSIINCTYTKRHTVYKLWVGSFNATVQLPPDLMTVGRHENQVVLSIAHSTAHKGIRFFDPLCGQMTFILPAAMRGATVYGTELIPRKFAEGLRSISRLSGQPTLLTPE